MKLYGSYTSPFVRHCRIVLLETGLPWEFIETDQAGSAMQSPAKKVPFLQDGEIFFTDSSSIIKYLREKTGQAFCTTAQQFDEYCLINTLMDACTNLFFLERDGVDIKQIPYLQRQAARIHTILVQFNTSTLPMGAPYNDAQLRLACFIGWAKLRRQVDFSAYGNLEKFYAIALNYPLFANTKPPG